MQNASVGVENSSQGVYNSCWILTTLHLDSKRDATFSSWSVQTDELLPS